MGAKELISPHNLYMLELRWRALSIEQKKLKDELEHINQFTGQENVNRRVKIKKLMKNIVSLEATLKKQIIDYGYDPRTMKKLTTV